MPPKKKREINPSAMTTRTRSGAKQLIREGNIMKLVDTKKVKKDAIKIETLSFETTSTRSHKKFGKYQVIAEKESPKKIKDAETSKSTRKTKDATEVNESPVKNEEVIENDDKSVENSEEIIEKLPERDEYVIEEENTSTVELTTSVEELTVSETPQEIVEIVTEEEEVPPPQIEEKMEVSIDDDSQEFSKPDDEAILSQQLSNLEFEMSNIEVVKTDCIMEEITDKEITYIDNIDSEVIIADDTIPVCYEQEVCLESETEEIKLENVEENIEISQETGENIEIIEENQEISEDEPELVEDKPELVEDKPELVEDKPELVEDKPELVEDKPELVEDKPELIEDKPELVKDKPELVEDKPELVEDKPELVENSVVMIEDTPETIEEMQETVEDATVLNIIERLETVEGRTEVIEDRPEKIEDKPETIEEKTDVETIEAHFETIDADVETIELMEDDPDIIETDPLALDTTDMETPEVEGKQKTPKPKKPKPQKKKPEKGQKTSPENTVRRSSRIKSISVLKQKSKGHGLVKHKEDDTSTQITEEKPQNSDSNSSSEPTKKPVKMKSRWTRSSELEQTTTPKTSPKEEPQAEQPSEDDIIKNNQEVQRRLKQFVHLKENLYLTERISCKEAKKMTCDCFLTEEEMGSGEYGCGEDCLNRLLMIECGSLCAVGDRCTNKRFQKADFAPVEVFNTMKKGLGIRAAANIPYGEFILEYVGEVLDPDEFENRATEYSKDKNQHYYFMALRADAVIDATQKGNISRFINHSCDPNAETQKWTVNGELRIGFFSKRTILAGEEVTFDYQFQRYGKEAQKCFCEAPTCRGWLGEEPDDEDDDEEDAEDDDEEEEEEEQEEEAEETVQQPNIPEAPVPDAKSGEMREQPEVKNEEDQPVQVMVKREKVVKKKEKKKIVRQRLPRKDIFEDLDLDEEIETLQTTGLKNQAHTLKLSRLMVRAKEPAQRTKLLRVLRRGELPCRRLFLDYHGLRLIHGWMTDAQHMAKVNKKLESLRLEILQTLATLPIPNKTMLQDSKVLSTVDKWSKKNVEVSPLDSDSNSPQVDSELKPEAAKSVEQPKTDRTVAKVPDESSNEDMDISPIAFDEKDFPLDGKSLESQLSENDYETEIVALGIKLLDEWSGLKEVFRIPKKERIEQMKEHEREADRKYRAGLGLEQDLLEKKHENRYGYPLKKRSKKKREYQKGSTKDDYASMVDKYERRKLFAMQYEQQDLERRRKQQEIWRQHEQRCMTMGADPKFTAPFDPNQGFQCIWNPQTSQWQNFPLPNNQTVFSQSVPIHFPVSVSQVTQSLIPPHMANPQMVKQMHTPPPTLAMQSKVIMAPQMQFRPNIPPPMQTMHVMAGQPMYQQTEHTMQAYQMQQAQNSMAGQGMLANIPALGMTVNKPPPLPTLPYQESMKAPDDPNQVKFMGPIPPPAKLPEKWKTAKDKYGRPYYYHIKFRKPQWEPPELPPEELDDFSETTSSSDTSSLSSDSSSEESDSDDEIDDTRLLLQIKNKFRIMDEREKAGLSNQDIDMPEAGPSKDGTIDDKEQSLDDRLEELSFLKEDTPQVKKRRVGLVQEILISPRTEEDKLQFKEDVKRYKANKEKLKRQKEMLQQLERKTKEKPTPTKSPKAQKKHKISVKAKLKEMTDSDAAKKIKETFRSSMAMVMVSILNPYRKPDCKDGRITNTEDFKHLARKLTHFVMLKELKHCQNIEDLTVTESVKSKAKEFVRKYMSKFGETYQKPKDEADFC